LCAVGGSALSAAPQWVFSADDQSSQYHEGKMSVRAGARTGAVSAFDFSQFPPKAYHLDGVSCSVIGPPACIAGKNGVVVVSESMRPEGDKMVSGSKLSLLEIDEDGLEIKDVVVVGKEPTSLSLSPDGKRVYVAVRGEGAVARYRIQDDDNLVFEGKQTLAKPEDKISQVMIAPDGKTALASLHERPAVLALDVQPDGSLTVTQTLKTPKNPYDIHFIQGGKRALISCTMVNKIATLERGDDGQWSVKGTAEAGRIAEGLEVSPDGQWVSVSCFDGANTAPGDKWYGQPGRVYMFKVGDDGLLTRAQTLDVQGVQQAAAFSPDGKYLLVGQFGHGNLAVFTLQDGQWEDTGVRLEIPGQCASLFTGQ